MAVAIDTLAYARRLRDAGLTERQAEGHAEALAAAMTDTLATKQDLRELEARLGATADSRFSAIDARFSTIDARFSAIDARFSQVELRIEELEKRMVLRFEHQEAHFDAKLDSRLADLEHRMTLRLGGIVVAGIGVMSALARLG